MDHDDNISLEVSVLIWASIVAFGLLCSFMKFWSIVIFASVLFGMWFVLWVFPTVYLHRRTTKAWPFREEGDGVE